MPSLKSSPHIIVALDYCCESEALELVDRLDPSLCRLKVGKELFTACGPAVVKQLVARNFDVFLDLKFHDIPNTVNKALKAARDLGVWMVNVHASGGARMLEAARAAYSSSADPILIAVTVLTSMEESDLRAVGIDASLEQHIYRLACLAAEADLDGVVCSARESAMLREAFGDRFCLVTPGIRPANAELGDQRRVVTPAEAIRLGSDYLVIGRPITEASDPLEVLKTIYESFYLDVTRPILT